MDFSFSAEQQALRESARRFAERELGRSDARDYAMGWKACARFGVLGSALPAEYGGSGYGLIDTMLVMEGLGYGCDDRGLLFGLNAQMWSVQHPLHVFGTPQQRARYLESLVAGDIIGAHAMTEPESGSDAFSLRTTATRTGAGYVLAGTKTLITNAPLADVFIVFANLRPERSLMGVTAFIVERGARGLSVGPPLAKLGLESSPLAEVVLQDCEVAEAARLGPEGGGAAVFNSSMEWERAAILASQIGSMQKQLDECVAYAQTRKQFKVEIGKQPPVRDRIADMKLRLELARLVSYKVGWLKDQSCAAELDAALAKLYVSEALVQSALDAMRTFGGYGYLVDYRREAELRDAVGALFYSGTSDMQRVLIARLLGL